jgi:hypothetical protein
MRLLHVGKLYFYNPSVSEQWVEKWPILKWSDHDKSWVLDAGFPDWTSIENGEGCIYIGRTNSVRIGAFLIGDKVIGIDIKRVS